MSNGASTGAAGDPAISFASAAGMADAKPEMATSAVARKVVKRMLAVIPATVWALFCAEQESLMIWKVMKLIFVSDSRIKSLY